MLLLKVVLFSLAAVLLGSRGGLSTLLTSRFEAREILGSEKWTMVGSKHVQVEEIIKFWLVGFGESCFQGRPIRYFTNPYAFTLYPTAELCLKTLHPDLVIPHGDSIQVLPAVSFWKRECYRLSYRGWAIIKCI